MKEVSITCKGWHQPMYIHTGRETRRVPNWYGIDFQHSSDINDFTWGYLGTGCISTAYAILREMYGKEMAMDLYYEFMVGYVSKLEQNKGFKLGMGELEQIVGRLNA